MSVSSFHILSKLGDGSFAEVFLAHHLPQNKLYAMKVIRKEVILKRHLINQTRSEYDILRQISHPFVTKLEFAFQTSNSVVFVMEYCPRGDLFYLIKERNLTEDQIRFFAAELVIALEYLHNNKIMHRDIKEENVMIGLDGHIRLGDFGLSREGIIYPDRGSRDLCGTPEYIAPEMLRENTHGYAVDWWGFGVLLFEMLVHWYPFYSYDRNRLYAKIRNFPVDVPSTVSSDASDLLYKLLRKEPTSRLGGVRDAQEVKEHPFFRTIDWDMLERGKVPAPIVGREEEEE
ncbi:uncharacterized protein [Blastocystis hominis]|uniref:Protein kinase domain-containing protein n=1 Tax=Blastocystis hominis TaxID=12968 RepID=D8M1N4_BLAHO|nr:uncharacterized protein [Blastocystis hominis]CBK21973.2 unnamed protein product [Blastocystis hominis]|eukprot:XP_012896021.1 uncharacterized protein [Blastocystis hominis]